MGLAKRIIACLDVKNGKTVKGVNFENLYEIGDPVALGRYYATEGVDELVYLDISATNEDRRTFTKLVDEISSAINIPFTVGGGINTIDDVSRLLNSGADKVSINTAAVRRPDFITEIADKYGSQCVVLAVDTAQVNNEWLVYTHGGKQRTNKRLFDWLKEGVLFGAGEILLTSIDHDGTKNGFSDDLINIVSHLVNVPIIASGGAGNKEHFKTVFDNNADAALAASIFHNKEVTIKEVKEYLRSKNVNVRI